MNQISTKNLHLLPDPSVLKEICKSLAALEAMICPEWEYRYYSYQKDWSATEEFCEMRNGQKSPCQRYGLSIFKIVMKVL